MFNRGSGDVTHGWERDVNERTRFITGLGGIDDYLRAEGALRWVRMRVDRFISFVSSCCLPLVPG